MSRGLEHEEFRWSTMSYSKMRTRLHRISTAEKMGYFMNVAYDIASGFRVPYCGISEEQARMLLIEAIDLAGHAPSGTYGHLSALGRDFLHRVERRLASQVRPRWMTDDEPIADPVEYKYVPNTRTTIQRERVPDQIFDPPEPMDAKLPCRKIRVIRGDDDGK
jgi:hypothetical protein